MNITEIIKLGPGAVVSLLVLAGAYWVGVRFAAGIDNLARRIEEAVDINTTVLLSLQAQLLAHDLTVSGLNPAAGATIDERSNRAYLKYIDVQRQIEEARQMILARHRPTPGKGGPA